MSTVIAAEKASIPSIGRSISDSGGGKESSGQNKSNCEDTATRIQTPETSTDSTNSPSTASKMLASHKQHPPDKTTDSATYFESQNDSSGRRASSTVARFKEKRPEPLKLNPNINQEIPLDLSVKSAGNIPSGIRGCIFNLSNVNQMTTLETPRIQWQDNEAFLSSSKSRLFSSSTSAGQRARLSSLMIGDSPPITPSTPFMDLMPSQATTLRSINQQANNSSNFEATPSTNHMICSPLDFNKFQILDRTNKSLLRYYQLRNEMRGAPRRSCSTDNLDYLCMKVVQNQNQNQINQNAEMKTIKDSTITRQQNQESVISQSNNLNQPTLNENSSSKKNAISPLAIKSLSSAEASSEAGRFSYGNQQIAAMNSNEDQKSPTCSRTNKAVTPTSVANATANLLNIHLNSPTRNQDNCSTSGLLYDVPNLSLDQQIPFPQTPSFSSLSDYLTANQRSHPEPSPFDPLLSAAYCHQNRRSMSINSSVSQVPEESQNNNAHNDSVMSSAFSQQHQTMPSFSSLATLNTPTIISPSQLKAGNICFLPSPTLSPMSSVFELPSPLLMFPQTTQQLQSNSTSSTNKFATVVPPSTHTNMSKSSSASNNTKATSVNTTRLESPTNKITTNGAKTRAISDNVLDAQHSDNINCAQSASDLSHLITPARRKVENAQSIVDDTKIKSYDNDDVDNEDVDMDVVEDEENSNVEHSKAGIDPCKHNQTRDRPATTIPQIYVTMGPKFQEPAGVVDRQKSCQSAQNENNWRHTDKSSGTCVIQRQMTRAPLNAPYQVSRSSQHINTADYQRNQRDIIDKRSLSPSSFRQRVNHYHNERLGSSSAPPDVNQLRVRSKIKTVEAGAHNELTGVLYNAQTCRNHDGTSTTPTDHTNRVLQQRDGSNEAFGDQNLEGASSYHCPPYHQVQNEFVTELRPTTSSTQSTGASVLQVNSSTNTIMAKPMIEGRSSSAEPPGTYQSKYFKSSPYSCENGLSMNQLPRDCHGLSHSAQQIQQNGSSNLQTRFWTGAMFGPNLSSQHLHQHPSHLAAEPNQQSVHQHGQQSISAGEINRIAEVDAGGCSRSAQLHGQPSQFYKTVCSGTVMSNRASDYVPTHQQRSVLNGTRIEQPNYHRYSMNELDNLLNQTQPVAVNVNRLTRVPDQKRQQIAPFSHVTQTATTNCVPQCRMDTDSFCSSDCTSNSNSRTFAINAVNLNANNHNHNDGHASTMKLTGVNTALTSDRLCSANQKCTIEAEVHSESLESNSLDFCSMSGPGSVASRSSSAASSNMTAKKYHCDQCSKSFTRSDMLTRHKRLHSGDRPFQCSECKQEFSRSDHLSTHMRTHTGEKPYRCKLCSYSACRKDMITRHMKVHNHNQTPIIH